MLNLTREGVACTRRELSKFVVPKRDDVGSRWQGIRHSKLADTIVERTEHAGFGIRSEEWATIMRGQGLVGVLRLSTRPSMKIELPKGLELTLGIRHSNNGRHALTFLAGVRVLVCSNGMISEIFTPSDRRRHTTGVDLQETVDGGLEHFREGVRTSITKEVTAMQGIEVTNRAAGMFLVEAGRTEVCPWSQLGKVDRLWRTPPHDEFKPRNAWSLFNAFTEVAKEFTPQCQIETINGARLAISHAVHSGLFKN